MVPIKPSVTNPYVGHTSKSSAITKMKKPWMNNKDIVHLKVEATKSLESEIRSKHDFIFLEKENKSVSPIVVKWTVRNHNVVVPTKILIRPSTINTPITSNHSSDKPQAQGYFHQL